MPSPEPRGGHAAAGIFRCAGWRGGGMAARFARATAGDAGGRIRELRLSWSVAPCARGIRGRPEGRRLHRGKNVTVEYRFADGQFERFPGFISEFVKTKGRVIVTSAPGYPSAKKATSTIPIVFSIGDDPVKTGIVPSLNRPGGNVTGVYQFRRGLEGKRLGLLHEMIPKAPPSPFSSIQTIRLPNCNNAMCRKRRDRLGVQACVSRANAESEFDAAFASAVKRKLGRCWLLPPRSSTPSANSLSC